MTTPDDSTPTSAEHWYQTGMAFLQSDDSTDEEAEGCFDRALAVDPHCPGALILKASFAIQHRRFTDALLFCDRVLALEPAALQSFMRPMLASVWRNKALALHGLGRFEEEIAFYEHVLAGGPPVAEQAELWGLKGAALLSSGKDTEAFLCIETAKGLGSPRAAEMLRALGDHARKN